MSPWQVVALVLAAWLGGFILFCIYLLLRYQLPNLIAVSLDAWAVRRYRRIEDTSPLSGSVHGETET